jgi:hypothetical protein
MLKRQKRNLLKYHKHMLSYLTTASEHSMITHLHHLHLNKIFHRILKVAINGKIQNLILTLIILRIPIRIVSNKHEILKFLYSNLSKILILIRYLIILASNLVHLLSRWLKKYSVTYLIKILTHLNK